MGQTSSSPPPPSPPSADAPQSTMELPPALQQMAERAPLHCVFYYEAQVVTGQLKMPLVYDKPDDDAPGTRLMDLELWLRDQFKLPDGSSVFAVAPAEELYSPPYPLVMLNTVAVALYAKYEVERVPVLHLGLVVRSMALLRQPVLRGGDPDSPDLPISAAVLAQQDHSIARQYACARFMRNMQNYGFARLEVTAEQARIPQHAFDRVRGWLEKQLALPADKRWRDRVDARDESYDASEAPDAPRVSKGRYVGFSSDRNRQYLQLRRPIAISGTMWPPAYFTDDDDERAFANEMLELFDLLEGLARDCMRVICETLNIDLQWMMNELLDDTTPPPAAPADVSTVDKAYQYGASVLRIYNYRNKAGNPNPDDASCAVHADLGLVTVSPVATLPGLQMWNMDRMTWTDVEADAGSLHFSVFAGETLGFITNGVIKAPLHRVPPIAVDRESQRRMSMPFFLRARPERVLNPKAPSGSQLTCRDFMEEVVFRKRPWRRDDGKNSGPDY